MTRAAQPVQPARAMIELFVEAYRLHLLRGLEEGLARCGYGLIAGVDEVGRGSWAGVTVLSGYQIGWMAVGVGALVGVAVRAAGKGTTLPFGILGAVLALAGCLVGNLLTGAVVLSRHWDISLAVFVSRLTPDITVKLMTAMFSPMDLLFYALAIWQGYKFSMSTASR